jgi:hypothetical protein
VSIKLPAFEPLLSTDYDIVMADHLNSEYRRFAQEIIQHELGHYVAGRVMGFGFTGMSLTILGRAAGHRGEAKIQLAQSEHAID